MTEREALKLALEALETGGWNKTTAAITALREALTSVPDWASEAKEQPAPATELREQEPVSDRENAIIRFALHQFMSNAYSNMNAAAQDKDSRHYTVDAVEKFAKDAKDAEALLSRLQFKAPQPAQQEFVCSTGLCYYKAQQQEPVAWLRKSDLVELRACNYMRLGADSPSIWAPNAPDEPSPDMELVAVYTSPPAQRTWVGLTDEDIASLDLSAVTVKDAISDVRAIEAKFKEKNTSLRSKHDQ